MGRWLLTALLISACLPCPLSAQNAPAPKQQPFVVPPGFVPHQAVPNPDPAEVERQRQQAEEAARRAAAATPPNGSYADTCVPCTTAGNTLSCSCRSREGRPQRTTIDFTLCAGHTVVNTNGSLQCERGGPRGSFSNSCMSCTTDRNTLACACTPAGMVMGLMPQSSIAYAQCPGQSVMNRNGNLQCGN